METESAANLQHPNIVRIHEVGEFEGQQYFSMEFVEGRDLGARARETPFSPTRAADYVKTISEAVHHAHCRGILHRDLKPSNVLIDISGQLRITDFGLAKRFDAGQRDSDTDCKNEPAEPVPWLDITLSGQVLGTPAYMSPEQARGRRDLTAATDIYSLGALLYFLLTSHPPFASDSMQETICDLRCERRDSC